MDVFKGISHLKVINYSRVSICTRWLGTKEIGCVVGKNPLFFKHIFDMQSKGVISFLNIRSLRFMLSFSQICMELVGFAFIFCLKIYIKNATLIF